MSSVASRPSLRTAVRLAVSFTVGSPLPNAAETTEKSTTRVAMSVLAWIMLGFGCWVLGIGPNTQHPTPNTALLLLRRRRRGVSTATAVSGHAELRSAGVAASGGGDSDHDSSCEDSEEPVVAPPGAGAPSGSAGSGHGRLPHDLRGELGRQLVAGRTGRFHGAIDFNRGWIRRTFCAESCASDDPAGAHFDDSAADRHLAGVV